MGEYEAAVSDVHSAIASGYPERQRHKLYIRLAKSYLNLGISAKARYWFLCHAHSFDLLRFLHNFIKI